MKKETICDMGKADLEERVLGRRIVSVDEDHCRLELDDGTALVFQDTSDCCSWFEVSLKKLDLADNAITAVRRDETKAIDMDADEAWKLTILSVDRELVAVEIEGDASNGYYCHSIELDILTPGELQK